MIFGQHLSMVNNIRKIAVAFLIVFLVLTVIKYLHTPDIEQLYPEEI